MPPVLRAGVLHETGHIFREVSAAALGRNDGMRFGPGALAILASVTVLLLSTGRVAAQRFPELVDPSLCVIAPLTAEELVDRIEGAAPGGLEAPATDDEVDVVSLEAVTATVRESVACTNANQIMRAFALFTDRYLAERFGGTENDDLGHLIAALSREPAVADEPDRLALVSISDPTMHADGSLAVNVTTMNTEATFVDRVWLIELGEGWRIDRVESVDQVAATPAP